MKKSLMFAAIAMVAIAGTSCKKAEAPKAMFDYTIDEANVTTVQFNNLSKNATVYKWEFGDTQTSTETNPKHTYAEGGKYTVTLTAEGAGGSHSYTEEINLVAPKVKIDGKFEDWDKMVTNKEVTLINLKISDKVSESYMDIPEAWIATDADFIYASFVYTANVSDLEMAVMQFDMSIDQDGNRETGNPCDAWADEDGNNPGIEYCVQYGDEVGLIAEVPGGNTNCGPESYPYWQDWAKYNIYVYDEDGNCDDGQGGPNWINQDRPTDVAKALAYGEGTSRVEFRIPRSVFPKPVTKASMFGIKGYNQGWEEQTAALPETQEFEGEEMPTDMVKFIFED